MTSSKQPSPRHATNPKRKIMRAYLGGPNHTNAKNNEPTPPRRPLDLS